MLSDFCFIPAIIFLKFDLICDEHPFHITQITNIYTLLFLSPQSVKKTSLLATITYANRGSGCVIASTTAETGAMRNSAVSILVSSSVPQGIQTLFNAMLIVLTLKEHHQ